MDDSRTELRNCSVLIQNGLIKAIGETAELGPPADTVVDASRHVVVPGLINTHHHMYQSLTKAMPSVQNAELFSWLQGLYPIWSGLTPEMVLVST
jgi:8-oxoguanine deaminase